MQRRNVSIGGGITTLEKWKKVMETQTKVASTGLTGKTITKDSDNDETTQKTALKTANDEFTARVYDLEDIKKEKQNNIDLSIYREVTKEFLSKVVVTSIQVEPTICELLDFITNVNALPLITFNGKIYIYIFLFYY